MNYAHHELEALSVMYALETWQTYFFGQQTVDVYTDSQAVSWIFQPTAKHQGRLLRWCLRASLWPVKIHHVKGLSNVSDILSRCHTDKSETPKYEPEPLLPIDSHRQVSFCDKCPGPPSHPATLQPMVTRSQQRKSVEASASMEPDAGSTSSSSSSSSCLLYTSPSPRDVEESRMPSSA